MTNKKHTTANKMRTVSVVAETLRHEAARLMRMANDLDATVQPLRKKGEPERIIHPITGEILLESTRR